MHEDTAKSYVAAAVSGKATGHYRFKKGFYGLADMPLVFHMKIDKALNFPTLAWQDDIIVVTRGTAAEHEEPGNKASERKSKLFHHSTVLCGYFFDDMESGLKEAEQKPSPTFQFWKPYAKFVGFSAGCNTSQSSSATYQSKPSPFVVCSRNRVTELGLRTTKRI